MSSSRSRKLRENRQYHLTQVVITMGSNFRLRNSGGRQDLIEPIYQIPKCNTSDAVDGILKGKRYLIHDRDPLFTSEFLKLVGGTGVMSVKLPARSPNLNAYAERFVRTIKESCLERLILFGEGSVRRAAAEFAMHYHRERNHQGLDNKLICPDPKFSLREETPNDVSVSGDC